MNVQDILALWPLPLVVGAAIIFIRGARAPKRYRIRGNGDYASRVARAEARGDMRSRSDLNSGGGGSHGGDGGD